MIKWNATKAESELIRDIAKRASDRANLAGIDYPITKAMMDLEACHCNGMPLDLASLAQSQDLDFSHDVFGIRKYINRENGLLQGGFVPRFAQHQ